LLPADDRVTVKLKTQDGGVENASFQYVIGCDGGRSIVRRSLGLAFEGDHYEQVFLLADVELDWKLERGYGYKLARLENGKMLGAAACILVPGNPRRYRFSTGAPQEMIPAELTSASAPTHGIAEVGPTLEQVQNLLTWFFPAGVTASNMRWSAFYRISHRLVSKYRVGRVFLAGDAAHLHPPLGGQGLNTGVQDAYNLAWKLALATRGQAADDLLDSYDAERRAIGQEIVTRTTARMNQVLTGDVDTQEPVREDSQLFLNYRNSPWVRNDFESRQQPDGPLAGDRAPDVHGLRRRYVRYDSRLFDLTRGTHYTLLVYTNHSDAPADCGEFAKLAAWIEQQYGSRLQTFIVLHSDCAAPAFEGLPIMTDAGNEFARLYGAQRGSAFLIRPDGYLAYRTNSVDQTRLQNYLQRIFKA
jgi:2-polyprenyl-6-methoxyphenol hydroxylase-like FAD-dependent oxidoreductase